MDKVVDPNKIFKSKNDDDGSVVVICKACGMTARIPRCIWFSCVHSDEVNVMCNECNKLGTIERVIE